jgi:hypothetical protein
VRSGDYFSQHVCIRVQASGDLFQGNGTNSQMSDHGAKYSDFQNPSHKTDPHPKIAISSE